MQNSFLDITKASHAVNCFPRGNDFVWGFFCQMYMLRLVLHPRTHTRFSSLSLSHTYHHTHAQNSRPASVTRSVFSFVMLCLCASRTDHAFVRWGCLCRRAMRCVPPANNCHITRQFSTVVYVLYARERVQRRGLTCVKFSEHTWKP